MADEPPHHQHRKRSFSSGNVRKRDRLDLICIVCHAPAIGYNFDQITCESCKAFFRRNALTNTKKLKCRTGTNDCPITLETRKRCKCCRLKKCFDRGLRKEWIMSEEEKRTKKQKIEDNRRLRRMSQSLNMLSTSRRTIQQHEGTAPLDNDDDDSNDYKDLLNDVHRDLLTKVEEHYTNAVRLNVAAMKGSNQPRLRNLTGVVDVVNEPGQMSALRMITFFKLTPEFHGLHEEDRLALVKHNLISILYLHFCICTNTDTEIFHEPGAPSDFCYHATELRGYSDAVYHQAMLLAIEVRRILSCDLLVMKLLILIMIFSKGADAHEPSLVESKNVFLAQNVFVDLLWHYLNVRFGCDRTASLVSRLIFACMKAHSIARESKESIARKHVQIDDVAPLMQSVLQIS